MPRIARLSVAGVAIALLIGCESSVTVPGGGGGGTAGNRPPVIGALTANPTSITVTEGRPITLQGVASDPEGDTIAYNWTTTGGTLNSTTGQLVYWVPPTTPGTYVVSLLVTDSRGASTSGSLNIVVNEQGQAVVGPSAAPTPVPTPSPSPVNTYRVNARTNVFAWQWQRQTIDVVDWGETAVTLESINAPYRSVIIEYEGLLSRQIAIIPVGRTLTLNFRGSAWAYCVGPSPVQGRLSLVSPGNPSQVVAVDQIAPLSGGLALSAPTNTNLLVHGGQAFVNTQPRVPFFHMLAVTVTPALVRYKVLRRGDRVPENDGTTYVGFTDTTDGLADNEGSWTIEAVPERD